MKKWPGSSERTPGLPVDAGTGAKARSALRIIYIANARLPSEKAHPYQIVKMCEALTANGARVTLAHPFRVQTDKELRQMKDYWQYYGVRNKFPVVRLPSLDLVWLDLYIGGFPWHLRFLLQAASFASLASVYALLKKGDSCYTRDHYSALLLGGLKPLHRKKIYHEAHTFGPVEGWLMKRKAIDGLITISRALKDRYVNEGVPEEKVLVAPDGVDTEMFDGSYPKEKARQELGISSGKTVVCYTGHLYDWKGVHVLVRSALRLPDSFAIYIVGGTEREIAELREAASREGLSNVFVAGHVAPPAVPRYLAASDIVVLPNLSAGLSRYTSPLKLFEYMAARRPIVASDLPAIREVLNEENSVLVEAGNEEALAAGIVKLTEDDRLAARVADNAFRQVQRYTWHSRAEAVLRFIGGRDAG